MYCVRAESSAQAIEIFMGNKRILSLSLNYTVIDAWMVAGDEINCECSNSGSKVLTCLLSKHPKTN
jgi:hypothetical protein